MASESSQFIDRVIRTALHPALKARGFTRKGHTWNRSQGDLRDVIGLQGSFLNMNGTGSFTVNLGKFSNSVDRVLTGTEPPGVVGELRCSVRERVGHLMPGPGEIKDRRPASGRDWWHFDPSADATELGQDAAQAILTFGLPFLDRVNSLDAMLAWLRQTQQLRPLPYPQNVHLAVIVKLLQDDDAAAVILSELHDSYARKRYTAGERLTRSVAERLGIELIGK